MCNYCGCQDSPLIGRLSAEHEAITNAAGRLREAITKGRGDPVVLLDALLRMLTPHTATEEDGLFPAAVIALPIVAWDRLTPEPAAIRGHR